MKYTRSSRLFSEAKRVIPGGVNSPVRSFQAVGGIPFFVKRAMGAFLHDEDGNRLLDFISGWGSLLFGHAYAPIIEAIRSRVSAGTTYGTPTELETKLATHCLAMVPNVSKIRFVNSGTEACMSAIRLARAYTKRNKIIKFEGCYHGHADTFLVKAGSGAATFNAASSSGVTPAQVVDTLLARYNDIKSVRKLFDEHAADLAAVIIEPVAGNMGCIPPLGNFLKQIKSLCQSNSTLLIFDEVMTGFRLAKGGAQELLQTEADIITYGKVIGGGLPVGAFASTEKIMALLAPEGPVYQAGTLSGNPLAMQAGIAMMEQINNSASLYEALDQKAKILRNGWQEMLIAKGIPHQINQLGSMLSLHFTEEPVMNFDTAKLGDNPNFNRYFHLMHQAGIYLPPSAYESCFLNNAMSQEDIDFAINAHNKVIKKMF